MLQNNQCYPSSDLWALGCTVFKMITGDVPFKGASDYHTFQKIIEGKVEYKPDLVISDEAKDLIDKLIKLDPKDRLGSGSKGSENDYEALKNHPFFKGLDFSKLNEIDIPIKGDLIEESPKDRFTLNKSFSFKDGIVFKGLLKKRNKFYWNQERLLVLLEEGKINYYKDHVLYRGTI